MVCGGGQREAGNVRKFVQQRAQQAIVRAEIMAPFGNAMRLVNREEGDLRGAQEGAERLPAGALRGDVEQVEIAVAQPVLRLPPVGIAAEIGRTARRERGCQYVESQ